jgi:translation initiation factor IF-1
VRVLGDGRFEVMCTDGAVRIGKVRTVRAGRRGRVERVDIGDKVLVGVCALTPHKVDIIRLITDDEADELVGKLPRLNRRFIQ